MTGFVFKKLQGHTLVADRLEHFDPISGTWKEVTGGSATVRFRSVADQMDMPGSVIWPRPLVYVGVGTRRWYAHIDGKNLAPVDGVEYEAFIDGQDQDGAAFSCRIPLPIEERFDLNG